MKQTLLLLLFFLGGITLTAQDVPADDYYTKQVGVDVTAFLARIFNFQQTNSFSQPAYYLTIRKMKEKHNTRFGIGADVLAQGTGNGTNSSIILNMRFGRDKAKDFGKHWQAYYGWDIKTNLAFASIGSSSNSTTQLGLGFGPVAGLQFKLNSRLVVSTEASYNFYLTIFDQQGSTNLGFLSAFNAPNFLNLNYNF